jgi:hypothetical protein
MHIMLHFCERVPASFLTLSILAVRSLDRWTYWLGQLLQRQKQRHL